MKNFSLQLSITNRDSLYLDKYLNEIGKISLLTEKEEKQLFQKVIEGDERAKQKIISANLRFVVSIAKQYQNKGILLCDLINEGNIGLIKAVEKFDLKKGFKFITYAVWWIRQQLILALNENGRLIRIPQNKINLIQRLNNEMKLLEQNKGRPATAIEISELLDIDVEEVRFIMQVQNRKISIDAPISNQEQGSVLKDVLEDSFIKSTDYQLNEVESLEKDINASLKRLTYRQQQILRLYFGINCIARTLEEIGGMLHITRERVRQIRDVAIVKLRIGENQNNLRRYLG